MAVNNYELEVFTPPCEPGAERYSTVAHLPISIADGSSESNACEFRIILIESGRVRGGRPRGIGTGGH